MSEKINYHFNRVGNDHGELRFGHIHDDNNISGVMFRTGEDGGRHYMTMDSSGSVDQGRKGSTINVCPGSFAIKAGKDVAKDIPAIYQLAENGDIFIGAPNGRIIIWAQNIELIASGSDGKNGNIIIDGNEKVIIKAPQIDVNSKVSTKIFSEKTVDVIGKAILNIYGGLIDAADGATKLNGSKPCAGPYTNEEQNKK
jgi:hypothetical protein